MHNDPTEKIPAIPNPHGEPTVQSVGIPGYLWADQEEEDVGREMQRERRVSMQEPRDSVIAWPPIAVFVVAFAAWSWAAAFGVQNINGILYVMLMWTR